MSDESLRLLIVHNHYGDYAVGGEAHVMRQEARLLERHGHDVLCYERANSELVKLSSRARLKALWASPWSRAGCEDIGKVLDHFRPDIMHVHNYWLVLSPSIFAAAKERGVATVLTLHNYRLVCPGGQFLCKGSPCEDCLDGRPLRVLWRRCYPGRSLVKSILSLRMYLDTRARTFLAPWVDAYIALSDFAGKKFAAGGLPAGKIHVKPNFIDDPLVSGGVPQLGSGAVFVGRLSEEKGLPTLLKAWESIAAPLTVVGDGPLLAKLKELAPSNVRFVGQRPLQDVMECLRRSAFLVLPSLWYEGFPITLLEAMAMGRAVLASDLGPRREMVQEGITGLLFRAGDAQDLRRQALRLMGDPALCQRLGVQAREEFLKRYAPEQNYRTLMQIYGHARCTALTSSTCMPAGGRPV